MNPGVFVKQGFLVLLIGAFAASASADVANLTVRDDPVNNEGDFRALGDINTSQTNIIEFNITQGDLYWEKALSDQAGGDLDSEEGSFEFLLDLSNAPVRFSEGTVNVTADQTDSGSFQEAEDYANLTVDNSGPPAPEIKSVERLSGGRLNITFTDVNSSKAETVEYSINRSKQGSSSIDLDTVNDVNSTQGYVDSNLGDETEYFYQVRAVDSAGNSGDFSNVLSEFADSSGPVIDNFSPDSGIYTSDQSKNLGFNITDFSGVDAERLKINVTDTDGSPELLNAGTGSEHVSKTGERVQITPEGDTSFSYNPGQVEINMIGYDSVGNTQTASWSFTVDTQEPQNIQVDNPSSGTVTPSQDSISGSYFEDNEIDYVDIQIQRKSDSNYWTGSTFTSSSQWVNVSDPQGWSFDSSSITSVDTYFVDVRATDKAGNTGMMDSRINYTIDKGAPDIENAFTNDTDLDGKVDRIRVKFTESIDDQNSDLNSAFEVNEGQIGLYNTGETVDDEIIILPVSGLDTGAKPVLDMTTGLSDVDVVDEAGNSLQANVSVNVIDDAPPVLLNAEVNHVESNTSSTVVKTRWSERVEDSTVSTDDLKISGKTLEFIDNSSSDVRNLDYGEPLDTGLVPNVSDIISVSDSSGNPAVRKSGENVSVDTFRRVLSEGWNFISFPISSNSAPDMDRFAPDSKVDEVWSYSNGRWRLYNPEKPKGSNLSYARAGEGYLFEVSDAYTLSPNVENIPDPGIGQTLPSIMIREGWNLVGHFQEFNQQPDTSNEGAFQSLGGAFGVVKGQISSGDLMVAETVTQVRPGHAYWISPDGDLSDGYVKYSER